MGNRKSPSEIARRENWKAMFAGAKRRGMKRASSSADPRKKAETQSQKDTEAPTRVMHGVTRSATERSRHWRSIAVPESTEKSSSAPHSMDTVRRVLRKLEEPSTDELGNRSPVIPNVTKSSPGPFQPVMSWPLPNGNGDCAVAHNGTVAVRYSGGKFAPIGSVGRTVEKNEKKRSVLKEVEPIYNAYLNRLEESERKR